MTALTNQSPIAQAVRTAHTPAIDSRPVLGKSVTIQIGLTPGNVTLFAAPVTVLATMAVGYILLTSLGIPLYAHEMLAGAIVSAIGGMLAAIPLFLFMNKGAQAIAQSGILSIAVRCGMILMGMILALSPAWGLAKMPFVYWVLGYYFPMLIVETAIVAWLSMKAKF
ncbi:MAG TPA: hypothetical protein VM008_17785 [Phycisphaerae bacterium]|nr:hypothetical protein [Phycisphaerae bacterium]